MARAKESSDVEAAEAGEIFFFYRPDVEEDEPSSLGDVRRIYIVLRPQGGGFRLLVVGRKRLQKIDQHERLWGFVETVTRSAADLETGLREVDYDTKTRGTRRLPAVRPAGEGVYEITLNHGEDAHLLDYAGAKETSNENNAHADTIRQLQMVKSRHPVKPLFDGKWA